MDLHPEDDESAQVQLEGAKGLKESDPEHPCRSEPVCYHQR